jgi:hypothetical protein
MSLTFCSYRFHSSVLPVVCEARGKTAELWSRSGKPGGARAGTPHTAETMRDWLLVSVRI